MANTKEPLDKVVMNLVKTSRVDIINQNTNSITRLPAGSVRLQIEDGEQTLKVIIYSTEDS